MNDNIADFSKFKRIKEIKENTVDVRELFGTYEEHHVNDLKSHLMLFINDIVINNKTDIDYDKIKEDELMLIKNMRVSKFALDRLIEIPYILGYRIDLTYSLLT
tara:strand:- start:13960 stop:14271 length:312 start_codon:yes stop_codon:yes gene_type:complete